MNSAFTGFVLAGGLSRRMGSDKTELMFDGRTLLEHQSGTLVSQFETFVVVARGGGFPGHFPTIHDHFENRGAPGGVHAALKNCRTEFALVLAVDLPFVSADSIKKLCKIAFENRDVSGVVPRQPDGRLQPLFAVYRTAECLPALETLLTRQKSVSLRDFLDEIRTIDVDQAELCDDPDLLLNLNTPADLERAVAILVSRAETNHIDRQAT